MARQLVWLKWRLLANGLRTDRQRRWGLPVIAVGLTVIAALGAQYYYDTSQSLSPAAAAEFGIWLSVIGWVGWATLPVLIFPIDETLDPAKFATLPMTRWGMMTGLTGAAMLTPPIIVPLLVIFVNFILWVGWAVTPVTTVAVVLIVGSYVVGGQAFTTAFSMIIKSRRGRDLTMLFVVGLGLGLYAAQAVVADAVGSLGLEGALTANPASGWAWLLPPGAAQTAITTAARGEWLLTIGLLGWSAASLVGLAYLWNRMLTRLITHPEATSTKSVARMKPFTELAGWGPTAVVVRKELRMYLRDPRMRMVWTGGVIFIGILGATLLLGQTRLDRLEATPWLVLAAPSAVLFVGLPVALNQFGWERRAASYLFALPITPRQLLVGKNIATTIALTIETAILTLTLAMITGGWSRVVYMPAILLTAVACQLAVGNLASVLTPLRLPDMGTDVFSQASEHGCLAIASQLVSFFLIGLLMVPPAVGFTLVEAFGATRFSLWQVAGVSMLYGAIIYFIGLKLAGFLLKRRMPEVLDWVRIN